jgi:hypothetical protein
MSSIRISPDFNTNRHSSLSFGSYRANCSTSLGSGSRPFSSLPRKSPWSVFQYGSYQIGLFSPTFCLSSYKILFSFPSRYFFAIGLSLYLALDVHTTPSYCITKQYYSSSSPTSRGLSPPLAPLSMALRRLVHNFALPLELLLVRSPLLEKSMFVSFPVLIDMLKFGTCSYIPVSLQPHNMRCAYRILYVGHRSENLSILYASW